MVSGRNPCDETKKTRRKTRCRVKSCARRGVVPRPGQRGARAAGALRARGLTAKRPRQRPHHPFARSPRRWSPDPLPGARSLPARCGRSGGACGARSSSPACEPWSSRRVRPPRWNATGGWRVRAVPLLLLLQLRFSGNIWRIRDSDGEMPDMQLRRKCDSSLRVDSTGHTVKAKTRAPEVLVLYPSAHLQRCSCVYCRFSIHHPWLFYMNLRRRNNLPPT